MYLGLAILMGTAWLRLSYSQENIQNVLNALFFGSAFMSFMVFTPCNCFLTYRPLRIFLHILRTGLHISKNEQMGCMDQRRSSSLILSLAFRFYVPPHLPFISKTLPHFFL